MVRIRKNDGETSGISSTETKDFDGDSIETVTGLDSGLSEYMYYDYYPYGTPIYSMTDNYTDTDPTFASHTQDEEPGQYYAKQRYYEPETGRFNRLDPVKDNLNWYAYCGGDPVNSFDPWGLAAEHFDTGIDPEDVNTEQIDQEQTSEDDSQSSETSNESTEEQYLFSNIISFFGWVIEKAKSISEETGEDFADVLKKLIQENLNKVKGIDECKDLINEFLDATDENIKKEKLTELHNLLGIELSEKDFNKLYKALNKNGKDPFLLAVVFQLSAAFAVGGQIAISFLFEWDEEGNFTLAITFSDGENIGAQAGGAFAVGFGFFFGNTIEDYLGKATSLYAGFSGGGSAGGMIEWNWLRLIGVFGGTDVNNFSIYWLAFATPGPFIGVSFEETNLIAVILTTKPSEGGASASF